MGRFIRFLFAVLLAPLFVAFMYQAAVLLVDNAGFFLRSALTYGFLFYLLVYAVTSQQVTGFFEVLEHEFAHAVAAIASFRQVDELKATPKAGATDVTPAGMHIGVALAPYCLPILLLPLLALCFVVPPPFSHAIDFTIGFVLAFHLVGLMRRELRFGQTDLKRVGYLFSFGVIGALNAALLVVVYGVVSTQYTSILDYLNFAYRRALIFYQALLEWLSAFLAG
jgi:hypothetical protein